MAGAELQQNPNTSQQLANDTNTEQARPLNKTRIVAKPSEDLVATGKDRPQAESTSQSTIAQQVEPEKGNFLTRGFNSARNWVSKKIDQASELYDQHAPEFVKKTVTFTKNLVTSPIKTIASIIPEPVKQFFAPLTNAAKNIWNGITTGASYITSFVTKPFQSLAETISNVFSELKNDNHNDSFFSSSSSSSGGFFTSVREKAFGTRIRDLGEPEPESFYAIDNNSSTSSEQEKINKNRQDGRVTATADQYMNSALSARDLDSASRSLNPENIAARASETLFGYAGISKGALEQTIIGDREAIVGLELSQSQINELRHTKELGDRDELQRRVDEERNLHFTKTKAQELA